MGFDEQERRRLARATELALAWHADQKRKGRDVPYLSHLLQVEGLVLEHGGDADQAVAALLHDALEDADSADERRQRERTIRAEFGADVLEMVVDCTDTGEHEHRGHKAPWPERKRRHLERLARAGGRSLLVCACDKRHNLHAIVADVRREGVITLERFNAGPSEQLWYFTRVVQTLADRVPAALHEELVRGLRELEALLPGAGRRG